VLAGTLAVAQTTTTPTAPDPATRIQNRVSRLATLLNLTQDQQTKAIAIFTSAETAAQALQTSAQTARTSLQAAIRTNDTATIDQLSTTLGTLSGQMTAIRSKADAAFYALLSVDQQAKFDTLHQGGFEGPGGPGHGHGGPGGSGH